MWWGCAYRLTRCALLDAIFGLAAKYDLVVGGFMFAGAIYTFIRAGRA